MFQINPNSGFSIKFPNGFSVSVQFGQFNYCSVRHLRPTEGQHVRSPDAEVAVIAPEGGFVPLDGDDVAGWIDPSRVAALIARVSAFEPDESLDACSRACTEVLDLERV